MKIAVFLCLFGAALASPRSFEPEIGFMAPPERIIVPGDLQVDNIPLIIGGRDALPGEFPYQISLQVTPTFGAKYHTCGGTILDSTHIVCAAHCVRGQVISQLEVVAGAQNMKVVEPEQQRVKVASVVWHPDYNSNTISHDASIITLATPLTFNNRVQALRLASHNQVPLGKCSNTGWGNARPGGGTPAIVPDALQTVDLEIIDDERCRTIYQNINRVDHTMVCAGDFAGGKGSCNGDSGGPLTCQDENGHYLAGIVSWGMQPCAQASYPTVFGRVGFFSNWLKNQN